MRLESIDMLRGVFAIVLATGAASVAHAGDPAPPPPPAAGLAQAAPTAPRDACPIAGRWSLDAKAGDAVGDPAEGDAREGASGDADQPGRARRAGGGGWSGRSGGGLGGGRFGGRGRRGGGGSAVSEEDRAILERVRDALAHPPATLVITGNGTTVEITDAAGHVTRWVTDGEPHPDERLGSGLATSASWTGQTLSAETDLGANASLTQTYVLEGDPQKPHLVVTTVVKGARGRTFGGRRVYDPAA